MNRALRYARRTRSNGNTYSTHTYYKQTIQPRTLDIVPLEFKHQNGNDNCVNNAVV